MSINPQDIGKALSVVQLAQMATSLIGLITQAVQNGRDGVTEEELSASFADKDAALGELAAAIARAKSEGR